MLPLASAIADIGKQVIERNSASKRGDIQAKQRADQNIVQALRNAANVCPPSASKARQCFQSIADQYEGSSGAQSGWGNRPNIVHEPSNNYRSPSNGYPPNGYPSNSHGYPSNGYPSNGHGYPSNGYPFNGHGHPSNGYPPNGHGFPSNGYSPNGYPSNSHGYPSNDYPPNGHGYPFNGYSPNGYPYNGYSHPSNDYSPNGFPSNDYGHPSNGYPSNDHGYQSNGCPSNAPRPTQGENPLKMISKLLLAKAGFAGIVAATGLWNTQSTEYPGYNAPNGGGPYTEPQDDKLHHFFSDGNSDGTLSQLMDTLYHFIMTT